ncbi:MAG: L-serine ammonia-lyase, iron-sulfur-dependent, subunit alpha [Lachnospiraceae bacterium]
MDANCYKNYVKILENELVPALGCTEPIAIAYAAAKARAVLGEFPDKMEMSCSGNIIKNVKSVVVPNSGGMRGIEVAAILGVIAGDENQELEVLESVTPKDIEQTKELASKGYCKCRLIEDVENLFIVARVEAKEHYAEVTIVNRHTLITKIVKDGEVLYNLPLSEEAPGYVDKSLLNVRDILQFAEEVKIQDIKAVIDRQVKLNLAISEEGMSHPYGAQVGRTLLELSENNVQTRAKAKSAAGSDARMGGCSMPVVINSGSGNQGMTVSIPVVEYAKELQVSDDKMYRALVISNLIAIHQKKYIGSLSAYCGAVSAACGSGAAIAYLYGGGLEEISHTIINTIANVGGIVCDGAKSSCAAKIASSLDAAIMAMELAKRHCGFQDGEGIVKEDVEETIKNMGYIGRVGMKETDVEILNLMIDRVDVNC